MISQGKLWMAVTRETSSGVLGNSYYDTNMSLSPIAYWRLGESSGTTAVDEIGNSDGAYTGGVALEQDGLLLGDSNTSVLFDGSTGEITGSDASFPSGVAARSINVLFNPTSVSSTVELFRYGTYSANNDIAIGITANGSLGVGIYGASIYYAANLQANNSYMATITIPENAALSDVSIYVNGVLLTNIDSSTNPSNFINTILNSFNIGQSQFYGIMDEVSIFDKELTQEEITKLYNATKYIKYQFTIDSEKIQEDLYNFPVLLNLDSNSGINSYDTTNIFDFPDQTKLVNVYPEINFNKPKIVNDDFTGTDGDLPNELLWSPSKTISSDKLLYIKNNALNSIISNAVEIDAVESRFELAGDYDVQIDYTINITSTVNSNYCGIRVSDTANLNAFLFVNIYNASRNYYSDYKLNGSWAGAIQTATSDLSGKFRVVRVNDVITSYYYDGSAWVSHRSATVSTVNMVVIIQTNTTSATTIDVSFDNFKVNKGTIVWPTYSDISDKNTQLQYTEIDRFDSTNKSAQLWTRVPYISNSSDTVIELICDLNSTVNTSVYTGVTGTSPAKNVWDSNFMAVYHLSNEPTGGVNSYINSTANSIPMTPINLDATNLVNANIGKAISFNGVDERFYISGLYNVPATNTIEAVHNADDRSQLTTNPMVFECRANNTVDEWMASLTCSGYPRYNNSGEYTTSGFYKYVAGSNDGAGNAYVFEQGYLKVTKGGESTSTADSTAQIGNRRTNDGSVAADGWLKGAVSEIRVSNIKRSDSYILASSYAYNDTLLGVNTSFTSVYQNYLASLMPSFYFKLNSDGKDTVTSNILTVYKYGTKLQEKSLLNNSKSNSIFFNGGLGLYTTTDFETDTYIDKTITFLAKFKDLASTQIIFKEGGSTNGWGIGIVNGVGFRLGTREGGTGNYGNLSTTGYNLNQVYHFVGIIDTTNSKIQLYIDNTLVIDATTTIGNHNGTHDPCIGNCWGASDNSYQSVLTGGTVSEPFHGYLSDLAIFNRVLTPVEINDLYIRT